MKSQLMGLLAALCMTSGVSAQMILIDFETEDGGAAIVNGKKIESPPGTVFGTYFTLTTTGDNLGAAAFDSTPGGPNDYPGAPDPDLLVDQGNVAILQSTANPAMTGDVFDIPNDSAAGGEMFYDFAPAVTAGFHVFVDTIDVVDRDTSGRNIITLTDENGLTRVVSVPVDFSGDGGVATVDLSSGLPTESPNIPGLFTGVVTDPGFDIDNVVSVLVSFIGSGAIDNFKIALRECLDGEECDDGDLCTQDLCTDDTCENPPVECVRRGTFCNPANGQCVECIDDTDCDDELYCNGAETCDPQGACLPGTPPNCDDGVACTDDSCDEDTDMCVNTPNDANCDDGLFCNGAETCDPTGDCQAGTPPDCDDGVACTDDSCDEDTDMCVNTPNDANCDDSLFCNGVETCDATGDCQAGTPPNCDDGVACTDDSCDEDTDMCVNTPNDANCDDGLFCNGAETCDATGDCQAGTPPNCDDGVTCTDDSCDEDTDMCVNTPNDANCDDGLFCNGVETCDATGDCQAGTPPDCDDGFDCTDDSCDEDTDMCVNTPNDANCDDGSPCTVDACVDGACENTPTTCPDSGDPCTELSCDPNGAQGNCDIESPRGENDPCDDGDPCTTGEVCTDGTCGSGSPVDCSNLDDQCNVGVCNATTGECEAQPANENMPCDDGDACLVGEVCTGGACGGGAPVECPDSGDPCTVLACDPAGAEGNCDNETARGENDPCDDGNACTSGEVCSGGTCGGGTQTDCSSLDSVCTVGVCDTASGTCSAQPANVGGSCDDGNECTEDDVCTPEGACAGTPIEGCGDTPPVPTVGRWGMIIMCLILVIGLVIRGKRRGELEA